MSENGNDKLTIAELSAQIDKLEADYSAVKKEVEKASKQHDFAVRVMAELRQSWEDAKFAARVYASDVYKRRAHELEKKIAEFEAML